MISWSRLPMLRCSALAVVVWLGAGCSAKFHQQWADHEVFGILKSKSSKVPNADDILLNITPPKAADLDKMARNLKTVEFLGDRASIESNARIINLADALDMAVTHNRDYLGRKEVVYAKGLDLTLERHRFALIPNAAGTGSSNYINNETTVTVPAPLAAAGAGAAVPKTINTFITEHTATSTGSVGLSALSRIGTKLAVDLSSDFVRFFTGGLRDVSASNLALSLSQPLLRGAGSLSVTEPLTQSERDVLYSIRSFTQYRKTFAIETATKYFQTLQSRDAARNAYTVYTSFKKTLESQSALADANRSGRTKSSLGLLNQAQLNFHRRWISAIKAYEEDLDDLKIQMGVPVLTPIILDQRDLDKLEISDVKGSLDEALQTAMSTRLDLWNAIDSREDASRHVKVAKRDTLPGLGIKGDYNLTGDPKSDGLNLDAKRRSYSVGLDVDLHLDQKPERNALRLAQIQLQAAERELDLQQEQVRQQVRASWRNLDLARKQYQIAEEAIRLGEDRLELERALNEADRGNSRDLIDAQQALIDARDQRIAALINHTIARIELWKDMGVLFIRKDGSWADVLAREAVRGQGQ